VAGVFKTVVEYPGYINMKGFPQRRVEFRSGVNEGPDIVFFGYWDPVQKADFIAVNRVPFRGPVSVIIGTEFRVPGGFRKEHRGDPRFFPDVQVKTSVDPLFYQKILDPQGQILGARRGGKAKEEETQNFPYPVLIIGLFGEN
jgi:hypothetical protein